MKQKAIETLLTVDNKALQDLHTVCGFDFCAPFGVYQIKGRYTVKQVEKIVAVDGYNTGNAVIAVCTRDTSRAAYGWSCDFQLVTIKRGGGFEIDYKTPYHHKGRGLDTFYTKGSFEEVRKLDNAETVIFAQHTEHIKKPVKMPVDLSGRFKLLQFDFCTFPATKKRYVNRLRLQRTDASGQKFDHEIIGRVFYSGAPYAESVDQVIDKSGYLLQAGRDELKRRAAALRAEREKAAFVASDNADKVKELEKRITARKAETVKALEAATTAAELEAVEKSLARWRGFAGIVADFERFREKVEKKSFASVAACLTAYNDILKRLKGGRENVD